MGRALRRAAERPQLAPADLGWPGGGGGAAATGEKPARSCSSVCLRVRPVGDQALGQLLPLGGGHRPVRRRRHRREIGIIGRLSGSQVLGVRRRIRIGVVLARPGQVTPGLDRIAGGEPEQQRNDGKPARRPLLPYSRCRNGARDLPISITAFPTNWPPVPPASVRDPRTSGTNQVTLDVLDPDRRVTTFDGENNRPPPSHGFRAASFRSGWQPAAALRKRR